MLEIGLGVLLFVVIVTGLVLVILAARTRLVPRGTVAIVVNDSRHLTAAMGDKLLDALNEAEIHLPSACGGVGTCGQCRVTVVDGDAALLPIERARIGRREAAAGARLACQVTVKRDMAVTVGDEVFGARDWPCTVRSARNVATLIRELVLDLPPGERMEFRAGAYVMLSCPPYHARFSDFAIEPEYRDEWDRLDLWRLRAGATRSAARAYSMANHPGEPAIVMLDVRIALPPPGAPESVPPGLVSSYLFGLAPGDAVTVSGPYGNFFAREGDCEMVFVGGGAGMAPMRALIVDQLERLGSSRRIGFWYGARSRRELFYDEAFEALSAAHDNFSFVAALSDPQPKDGWDGPVGFVHQVLYDEYLKDHPAPEDCEYYLCGPPMMIRAVRRMLDNLGVDPENVFFDDFGG